ncbi:MAG: recombination protein RecR [Pseudomonadota bacterium]|jgi:recombination protein RecR
MSTPSLLERLMEALRVLPGVGPKSAQRMALAILQKNRPGGRHLAAVLSEALDRIGECASCRSLTETPRCPLCEDPRRDDRLLCIVESPADILALEHAGGFRGRYFVLHGHLSPIDRIGPEQLGLHRLVDRVRELSPEEVILATNPTVEGEATAHYISELLKGDVAAITRIAHGVPLGGELEFIDGGTLVHALQGRRRIR